MQEGNRYGIIAFNAGTYLITDHHTLRNYVLQITPISSRLANTQFTFFEESFFGHSYSVIKEELWSQTFFALDWSQVVSIGSRLLSLARSVNNLSNPTELYSAFGGFLFGDSVELPRPNNKDHH